jgi:hypothetical protein
MWRRTRFGFPNNTLLRPLAPDEENAPTVTMAQSDSHNTIQSTIDVAIVSCPNIPMASGSVEW